MVKFLMIVLCLIANQHKVFGATTAQSICDSQEKVGNFPNPDDVTCKQYAKCFVNNGVIVGSFYNCTGTTLFNPSVQQCVVGYVCVPITTTSSTVTTTPASTISTRSSTFTSTSTTTISPTTTTTASTTTSSTSTPSTSTPSTTTAETTSTTTSATTRTTRSSTSPTTSASTSSSF